jgi:hypothetical protein
MGLVQYRDHPGKTTLMTTEQNKVQGRKHIKPCAQIVYFYNVAQAPSITPPTVAARADKRGAETWKRWPLATAPFLVLFVFLLVDMVTLVRFQTAHLDDVDVVGPVATV